MADLDQSAHLQQQHIELTRQIDVTKEALKSAKSDEGGATYTLENQLKELEQEKQRVEGLMKEQKVETDPAKTQRQMQVDQAREQANIMPRPDVEGAKQREETQRENLSNQGGRGGTGPSGGGTTGSKSDKS